MNEIIDGNEREIPPGPEILEWKIDRTEHDSEYVLRSEHEAIGSAEDIGETKLKGITAEGKEITYLKEHGNWSRDDGIPLTADSAKTLKDLVQHSDKSLARAIESNREAIGGLPTDGLGKTEAKEFVAYDLAALSKIVNKDERHFAAVSIGENAADQANYKEELARQDPVIIKEVKTAVAENARRISAKEDRKAADFERASHESTDEKFVKYLDERMAKSELAERGWRDRNDIDDVMQDLQRLAQKDWQTAAKLWSKYRPEDKDKPVFIDGDDIDEPKRALDKAGRGQDTDKSEDRKDAVSVEALRKRYLQTENKFYFRDEESKVAFEDKGKRLATEHDDPQVARSMVELAHAKNWQTIKIKGTEEFKREVWLQASLRGMEVQGYQPRDVDHAKLADLRQEQGRTADLAKNTISRLPERSRGIDRESTQDEPEQSLSKQQKVAIDALKTILRARGDSEKAVEMAATIAAERFQTNRVYVGKLIDHGQAPYENEPKNEKSYFMKVQTENGDKVIWGADLQRAIDAGKAKLGEDVAVAYQGRKPVEVTIKDRDAAGNVTGERTITANRNKWDVSKLENMREEVKERLAAASRNTEKQPLVKVYDRDAPRQELRREPSRDDVKRDTQRARG